MSAIDLGQSTGFEILGREDFSDTTFLLRVSHPAMARAAKPGQFVIVLTHEHGERIPLTIADFDKKEGSVTLVVQAVGKSTREMQQTCQPGTSLYGLVGPMGNPSEISDARKVVCVGGGLGVAPIYPQARAFRENGAHVIGVLGFRNRDLIFWEDNFRSVCDELILCTDDGSAGLKGLVTLGIEKAAAKHDDIDEEIGKLAELGVEIRCNTLVGRLFTIEDMLQNMGFDAVFIGTGAGAPRFMGIEGENLNGVLSANELLTRCNLMHAGQFPDYDTPLGIGKRIAVIGAGNTAMDAMRVCLRLGAEEVHCVYRRTDAECPARLEELHHAQEEGIEFHWLTAPVEILGDEEGRVRAMRCIRMELGEPDESGRRRPVPVEGSEFEFAADTVVYAIGTQPNPILGQTSAIKLDARGYIETDNRLATSMAGVYAGGDIVTGAATVILAMGAGRKAARSILDYLGVRDSACVYEGGDTDLSARLFGIDNSEKNFVRVRAA